MATIIEQIPGFDDDQLAALRQNAARISESGGKEAQRAAARAVLEATEAEIGARGAAKKREMAERLAKRNAEAGAKPKRSRKKPAAAE